MKEIDDNVLYAIQSFCAVIAIGIFTIGGTKCSKVEVENRVKMECSHQSQPNQFCLNILK